MNDTPLRWGIVGPGQIARVFATSLRRSGVGEVTRVFGRRPGPTAAFCEAFGGEPVDKPAHAWSPAEVDAVYVATPHPSHADAVRHALQLGTPVLCEKPMTPTAQVTRELVDLSRETGTPLMEAWMYRTHPQIARTVEMLAAGALGRPLGFEARFGFMHPFDPEHRLHSAELAGGAVLDVGGYPVSLALLVGAITNQGEAELREAHGELAPTGVDRHAQATFVFRGGLEARVEVATDRELPMSARITGESGRLTIHDPWLPEGVRDGLLGRMTLETEAGSEQLELEAEHDMFTLEARAMTRMIQRHRAGEPALEPPAPLVRHEESIRIARHLEDWRTGVGAR